VIETLGLRHIHLHVRDLERSVRFYCDVFGGREDMREGELVFIRLPSSDIVTLNGGEAAPAREMGGIAHFGLRLKDKADLDDAVRAVEEAGGRLLRRGEHAPGHPFAYLADPDGYVFEL
jgi:catechol 2,3-dioxygenase-like lactoylglutathione lyase family enzyme